MEYVRVNYTHENMNSAYLLDDYFLILNSMANHGFVFKSCIPILSLPSGKVIRADLAFENRKATSIACEEISTTKVGINNRELDEDIFKTTINEMNNKGYEFAGFIPLSYTCNGQVSKLAFVFYKY